MKEVSTEQLQKWLKIIQDNKKSTYWRLGYLERELERLLNS